MRKLIESILNDDLVKAKELLFERWDEIVLAKTEELKLDICVDVYEAPDIEIITEGNVQKIGRTKIIRARVRAGKVQRRKKFSAVPGYTIRGGKLIRMSTQERRHRKQAAKRSKYKRRSKLKQSLRKRKISLRKRHSLGIR